MVKKDHSLTSKFAYWYFFGLGKPSFLPSKSTSPYHRTAKLSFQGLNIALGYNFFFQLYFFPMMFSLISFVLHLYYNLN